MLRHQAIAEYKAALAIRLALSTLYPHRGILGVEAHYIRLVSELREYRQKRGYVSKQTPKSREFGRIKNAINNILGTARRSIFIKVDGQAKASRPDRKTATINVGAMWHRRVWQAFYKNGNLRDTGWFVLKAEEVRVNHPFIRLWEAMVFNYSSGEVRPAYIGQLKVGTMKAEVKFTASQAVNWAKAQYDNETNNILIGEK